jgi:dihydroorotate dehydrogenase (NAD+) catalytic subunit
MSTDAPLLELGNGRMNAAGSLGFVPSDSPAFAGLSLGVCITNPISLRPRKASQVPRLLEFPGGVLLHTGWPNPGLRSAVSSYANAWARAPLPVVLHLLVDDAAALRKAMPRIEELENIAAIELNIPTDASPRLAADLVAAAAGELAVIAQLSLPRAEELADGCLAAGASAVSLGPPRGSLPAADGRLVNGRLYGPAIFAQALAATQTLAKAGVPVIAAGGIEGEAQERACRDAGAIGIQMDVGLWK